MRWKINGVPVPKNPSTAQKNPIKNVEYKQTIIGPPARITNHMNLITMEIDASWRMAPEEFRDQLYLLYAMGDVFLLETHIKNSGQEIWTMRISQFDSSHTKLGQIPKARHYDVNVVFQEVTQGLV